MKSKIIKLLLNTVYGVPSKNTEWVYYRKSLRKGAAIYDEKKVKI